MTAPLFGLWGQHSSSWITLGGRVIAHTSREELEFLCPGPEVKPINGIGADEVLMLRDHPNMASVRWPLNREDFRR